MRDIYNCPCCGKNTFTPFMKARAGQLNSKGIPCPECNERITNGEGATIFNAIFSVLMFAIIIFAYLKSLYYDFIIIILAILLRWLVPKCVNAFFFKLDISRRKPGM